MITPTPTSPDNFGGLRENDPEFIILHGSGLSHNATAENEVAYLQRPGIRVSYTYYIKKDGQIIQLVPETHVAFHAGVSVWSEAAAVERGFEWHDSGTWEGLNAYSIGIGLESHNDPGEVYPEAQLIACHWLCTGLMLRYDIPARRVLTHEMISAPRKHDPVNLPYEAFVDALPVKSQLSELIAEVPDPTELPPGYDAPSRPRRS